MPVFSLSPPRRGRFALGAAVAALAVVVPLTVSAQAAVPPTPAGWTLQWSDDFNGAAGQLPSSANWIFDLGHGYPGGPGNWGTGEIAAHTNNPNNVSLDGAGNLRITPRRDAAGNWTSARLETHRGDFKAPAGGILRIEGRVQMPNVTGQAALGYWPAFWALGSPYRGNYWNWPGIGEFDIMENVNGINSVWGVLHCGVNPGGPCNETNGLGASRVCPGASCQSAFHTYRFEWDQSVSPNQLRWYVDGQQFHSVSQNQMPADAWRNMTTHAGYFILLNVAIGGAFPDGVAGHATPTGATVPGHPMVVDYVAVWTSGGAPPTTTTPPPTTTPPTTTPPPGGGNAYGTIQAEAFQQQSGMSVYTAQDTGGGGHLGAIGNGDWALYRGIDFGSGSPATQFVARAASGAAGGVSGLVEVRLDSRTNPPIGSFAIANTGGWQSWRTIPANISGVTGVHDVYVTFASGQPADFVNLNWFTFGK
ncbi:Beta-glucanase, GH16 family [Actinokineospora alba]|uniref:Beta-glucanase, GH16 family n=1 Tax=Actinokineospora alba TaxID=504798 RepID=A0A1H0EM43_9PSEU|nr:carbohydrate-binding protein [Actinokineospora alba]TDP69133.1 beta-glucanase (GH16 family) [Actinokineospora alba]SDI23593.1 Beta-glucanase, GH16 family [Actinokineospora alba]SDN83432.1 Beta-glucanase, GH16 family [Actinokineospora alba]